MAKVKAPVRKIVGFMLKVGATRVGPTFISKDEALKYRSAKHPTETKFSVQAMRVNIQPMDFPAERKSKGVN